MYGPRFMHTDGAFYTGQRSKDPDEIGMTGKAMNDPSGDRCVFDVGHNAGRCMNEEGHPKVACLQSGSDYVPGCTPAEPVILA